MSSLALDTLLSSSSSPVLVAVVLTACSYLLLIMPKDAKRNTSRSSRSWSFTSRAMAIGSFPEKVQFPDPVINAVLLFNNDCPTQDDVVQQVVMKLLLKYDRFSGVYDPSTGGVAASSDELDPTDLVRIVNHDSPNEAALFQLVEKHMYDPVAEGTRGQLLPWWEFLILQNSNTGKPSAVIWRIHHALADGLSMVKVVQDIITDVEGNSLKEVLPAGMKKKFKTKRSFCTLLGQFFSSFGTLLAMPTGKFDDDTIFSKGFHGEMVHTHKRSIIRFEPIPLDFAKALKNAVPGGASINDILYTAVSQAIHDYLVEQNDPVLRKKGADLLCRALMPIGLPSKNGEALGNKWCFLDADLAVGMEDIMDRLNYVHETMSTLKTSLVPLLTIWLQNNVLSHFPMNFNRNQVLNVMSRRSTIFSNVPGPNIAVLFANKEVTGVQMVFGNLITQLGFLSYRGTIFGNFCMDTDEIPKPERLAIHLSSALVKLANKLQVDCPTSIVEHAKL